jgi:hypothetical protein
LADLKNRIEAFVNTGLFIKRHFSKQDASETALHQGLDKVIELSKHYNGWFEQTFVNEAITNIGDMLGKESLEKFCTRETKTPKTVAVICAGNIPLVGFHDVMCVLLTGHTALIKLSSTDNLLLPFFLKLLTHYETSLEEKILFADGKLAGFDAVIATGSNNTAAHFEYYFSKYPHIIRKNRTSIAVLKGDETNEELKQLGKDVFLYFGLGCRNVGKLLVPENYDFNKFFEAIIDFGFVVNNSKYGGNYDYNRAIYLLDSEKFLDNNFLILKRSEKLHSPVSVLFYEYFSNENEVKKYISDHSNELQCIVGKGHTPFGYSQRPVISDFADNINTLQFLVSL